MSRRIWINLIAFVVLGVVMTTWALNNVITIGLLDRPRHVKVEFASSPGLQPNFDVAYVGVKVGKISSVRLGDHKIVADLALDRHATVPGNVIAAAGRKSAIGEPYVDLSLPPGAAEAPPLHGGETIPLSRTSVAIAYDSLFAAANKAISGLDPDDLHTITHEVALGWTGRSDSLAQILDSTEQITGTFASNTALLDGLISRLTLVSTVLTDHRGQLATGLDGLAAVTSTVARNAGALKTLERQGPDLVQRFNEILTATAPASRCVLRSLDAALPVVLSKPAVDSFRYQSKTAPQLVSILNEIAPSDSSGNLTLNIDFVITLNQPEPAAEFISPRPLPTVGDIPSCPGVVVPAVQRPASEHAGTADAPKKEQARPSSGRPTVAVRDTADHSVFDVTRPWTLIPPVLALMILLVAVWRAVPVIFPRRKNRGE
jgi:phospholipid/cholesterol/gamma-HCH transport system substrate-binding protein